ncbi:dihydropteroate synthase [Microbacterium sp. BG28]|uniref:dihydropteroate synthase n=1 Tax=Microbacterium sp. BG28 TaxID=3097356 RepID=UPI002A59CF15|nr:dihydropteroate synthase [Microbacterium sp. BG28]MDY0828159.1 dihydropteroate synthase [Microbacterium sp. BG28]
MGIVNVTPDSFSDGGRFLAHEEAVRHALRLVGEGAQVIDVGGESTRPGAERVGVEVEQERILPVVHALSESGVAVSVDTMNAATAAAAVAAGARIINDVSGGLSDPAILDVAADAHVDMVLGHWRGHSDDMYAPAQYRDLAREVTGELIARMEAAASAGIPPSRLVLDPGVGFAKRGAQNWEMLRALPQVVGIGPRVLVGTSRKRFLGEMLGTDDLVRRDRATAVTSALAAHAGAWGVRVHDVQATADALAIAEAWRSGGAG